MSNPDARIVVRLYQKRTAGPTEYEGFIRTPEFDHYHVYLGRALTLEELSEHSDKIFLNRRLLKRRSLNPQVIVLPPASVEEEGDDPEFEDLDREKQLQYLQECESMLEGLRSKLKPEAVAPPQVETPPEGPETEETAPPETLQKPAPSTDVDTEQAPETGASVVEPPPDGAETNDPAPPTEPPSEPGVPSKKAPAKKAAKKAPAKKAAKKAATSND